MSSKLFLGGDLEELFNVGEKLTRFQDVGLHKNIKLTRDFGLLVTHSLMSCKLQALCVTHRIIMMINIIINTLCCNPSLGLVTKAKARAYKVMGQEEAQE